MQFVKTFKLEIPARLSRYPKEVVYFKELPKPYVFLTRAPKKRFCYFKSVWEKHRVTNSHLKLTAHCDLEGFRMSFRKEFCSTLLRLSSPKVSFLSSATPSILGRVTALLRPRNTGRNTVPVAFRGCSDSEVCNIIRKALAER